MTILWAWKSTFSGSDFSLPQTKKKLLSLSISLPDRKCSPPEILPHRSWKRKRGITDIIFTITRSCLPACCCYFLWVTNSCAISQMSLPAFVSSAWLARIWLFCLQHWMKSAFSVASFTNILFYDLPRKISDLNILYRAYSIFKRIYRLSTDMYSHKPEITS